MKGKFKTRAHIKSRVVIDIAVVKVSHSVLVDIDATALRAARARSSSIGAPMETDLALGRAGDSTLRARQR